MNPDAPVGRRTVPPPAADPIRWWVFDDRRGGSPAERVGRDLVLGTRVAARGGPPTYRVWRNEQCLVVTRRERRLPRFRAAVEEMAPEGWPVVVRDSGGTAVPHLRGTLQLTLALPREHGREPTVEAVYRALIDPVRRVLWQMGLAAAPGEVPRSFCDGRFNLVVKDRKVAGTAQRWKGGFRQVPGGGRGFIFAHLSLFVEGDMEEATRAVNRFLERAGGEGGFDPGAATTVAEELGLRESSLVRRVRSALVGELESGRERAGLGSRATLGARD